MALKPFFPDDEDAYFDRAGRPKRPGQYEFERSDGRRIIYSLDFERLEGDAPDGQNPVPRLRVIRASRLEDYPQPPHALRSLDGEWLRFLSDLPPDGPSQPMIEGSGAAE